MPVAHEQMAVAVSLSVWLMSKVATSVSTACANSARAPLRNTSVSRWCCRALCRSGEVNWLHDDERPHVDLAGGEQRPEQHGGSLC